MAASQELREVSDTRVDDLEQDLTESQAQHSMPGVLRVVSPIAVANRFSSLAAESDGELDLGGVVPGCDRSWRRCAQFAVPFPHVTPPRAAILTQEGAAKRRAGVVEPIPTNPTVVVRKTCGAPQRSRVEGQRVHFGSDRHDPARSCAVSQFAVHVAHHCGWLGCRVGEDSNPGPATCGRT